MVVPIEYNPSVPGGPNLLEIRTWQWSWFEIVLITVIVNAFLCYIDFLQVYITGSEGSHSYGRFQGHKTFASYFPSIPNRLGWVYMEVPSVLVFLIVYFMGSNCWQPVPFVLMLMWQTHYFQRSFIYPLFLMKSAPGRKQNLLLCSIGFMFNSLNSYLNAHMISEIGKYDVSYFYDIRFIVGLAIFVVGYNINRQSDAVLARLRESPKKNLVASGANSSPSLAAVSLDSHPNAGLTHRNVKKLRQMDAGSEGDDEDESDASTSMTSGYESLEETSHTSRQVKGAIVSERQAAMNEVYVDPNGAMYKIPFGGPFNLYDFVCSPNYFGEILEWFGWTICTSSVAGLSFMLFTCGNLVPRAYWNNRWYQANFKHYPKQRKAVFPLVF